MPRPANDPNGGEPASWFVPSPEGDLFPLLCFPGTAVPGSGFLRPFRDWFAEKICGRTGLELCRKRTTPAGLMLVKPGDRERLPSITHKRGNVLFVTRFLRKISWRVVLTFLATLLNVKVVVFPRPAVELSPFAAQVREARHH
jgi:hypothetical protein